MIQSPLMLLKSAIDEKNTDQVVALLQTLPSLKQEKAALTYLQHTAEDKKIVELTKLIILGDWDLQFHSMYYSTGWEFLDANGYEDVKQILALKLKTDSVSWTEPLRQWAITAASLLTGFSPAYSESTAYYHKELDKLIPVCLPHLRFTCKTRAMVAEITSIFDLFGISYNDSLIKNNNHLVTVSQDGLERLNEILHGFYSSTVGLEASDLINFKKEKLGYYYQFCVSHEKILEGINQRIQKNTDFICEKKDGLQSIAEGWINSFANDWVSYYTRDVEPKEHLALTLFAKKYGLPVWDSKGFQNLPLEQGARLFFLLMSKVEPEERRCMEVYRNSVCAYLPAWIRDSKIPTPWQEIVSFSLSEEEADEPEQATQIFKKRKSY